MDLWTSKITADLLSFKELKYIEQQSSNKPFLSHPRSNALKKYEVEIPIQ
jgi:hypothetical protein